MASSYSDLGLELMVTGENSGTWGDKTNTNLNLVQQAIAGYEEVSIAGGAQTTALAMTDATLSNARNAVLKFTGTITGNQIVTIPDSIEKAYILQNATTGSFTVQFKTVSGTGVTFSATDKGFKQVFSDGTNVVDVPLGTPGGSDTQIQFNNSDAFGGSADLTWDGSNVTIGSAAGDLRLTDSDQSHYVALQAGAMSANLTLTLPTADGTADQVLKTNGSGTLSFGDVVGGESWQAVKTTGFTAVAGEGYFIDTTGGAITMTLPATPSIGDFITFIDYAGTFDTNNLTIGRNSENIQGSAADLTVSVERAANTLVYVDSTQGWLLKVK
jgi:hypothetical protein